MTPPSARRFERRGGGGMEGGGERAVRDGCSSAIEVARCVRRSACTKTNTPWNDAVCAAGKAVGRHRPRRRAVVEGARGKENSESPDHQGGGKHAPGALRFAACC